MPSDIPELCIATLRPRKLPVSRRSWTADLIPQWMPHAVVISSGVEPTSSAMVKASSRKFAQGSQKCRILVLYEITDHHGFAAAAGRVRERSFLGRAADEAGCVFERIGVVAIVSYSASTKGRSSARVVDSNNRLKVAFAVESSDHSFVITFSSGFDDLHGASFRSIYRRLYLHHAKFFHHTGDAASNC